MNADPATIAKDYIIRNIDVMRDNLILKEWNNRDVFSELKAYYQENEETIFSFAQDFFLELLKRARAEKKIREDVDDQTVLSLIDTLSYLDNHQDEVGVSDFPKVLQLLAEFVINGLTSG
jgi:hypothetical protein